MTRQVASNSRVVRSIRSVVSLQKAFLAIILVVIAMALFNLNPSTRTEFFTEVNFIDLAKSSSIFLILAMGETFVLIAGGVDLSIGGMMALSGVVVIQLINAGVPIPLRHRPVPLARPRGRRGQRVHLRVSANGAVHHHPRAWGSC